MDKQTLTVAGLPVNIFSLKPAADGTPPKPVAILFLLHGRTSRADHVELVAKAVLDEVHARGAEHAGKDLWVVTFDHRNHGARVVDGAANRAWDDGLVGGRNDRHAIDMYAIQTGTAQDVSFLIDFLPAYRMHSHNAYECILYLFPGAERVVSDWLVGGISLGGHSTWITLKNEPRVKLGIPIIGCPDYLALITPRAEQSKVPIAPPYFPKSLLEYVAAHDPAAAPHTAADAANPFRGKKVLVLCGGADTLVPWAASRPFVDALDVGPGGVKEVVVEDGVGHACSPAMVAAAARFLWENVLERK
ncbi:Alpha/Beta hydrolase protein [Epithele typhae]|uniref:Alpha/Beta hydrolase protein n=1 Tax=Epithele typhae TaxID=378194 RepID=UPI0020080E5F|nr:Alpha/Beta hydrolase protein [Epithele typhae]KAH9933665.1 Alpha/Beta hydrolase protein [Epithele typhae]